MYINQGDAQILVNNLYFSLIGSTCFGPLLVHHVILVPERLTAARRTGTNVPIALYSLLNVAPDDGPIRVRNM